MGLEEWGFRLVMGSSLMLRLGFILHAAALIVYLWDLNTFVAKVEPGPTSWQDLYIIACTVSCIAQSLWAACTFHVDDCFYAQLFLGSSS